jgi:23S rRNA (cytosine1962-C5)-methyltransferase
MKSLHLNKTVATRVVQGHPWVYRNELPTLPSDFPSGEGVELTDSRDRFIAIGYCNPKSVITVRILTREREKIDGDFFLRRIGAADIYRKRFYAGEESYRVVYSEADFLPGLIVDRYGSYVVIQTLTAGMERQSESILAAIESRFFKKKIFCPQPKK